MVASYRGRLAPTPTGWLHLGHAATFLQAARRAESAGGVLILRIEDLDTARCLPQWTEGIYEDLRWLGFIWQEGPDCGGRCGPYLQSERRSFYLDAWRKLRDAGCIYPCRVSRKDMQDACRAPQEGGREDGQESVFPVAWRTDPALGRHCEEPGGWNWRFRVPDGETLFFEDGRRGYFAAVAGKDFGDFPVWRRDDVPAYELAVVVDDAQMGVTEVVRGEDLLLSTCRQLLLYRALGYHSPEFYHTALVRDASGRRLAKRDAALALRTLREQGVKPNEICQQLSVQVAGDGW